MSTAFPTALDSFPSSSTSDTLASMGTKLHTDHHNDLNAAIAALEAKLGVNSSAVTSSHDYKLSAVTGTDKAVTSSDSRLTDGRTPNGSAGGDLTGTYPNPTLAVSQSRPLFDHYTDAGNSTTTETDLYSDTLTAGRLANNGEKIEAEYGGVFVSSATATRQVKVYFGGTAIFDTGALTLSLSSAWTAYATIIRVSSSVVRYMVSLATEGAALSAYTAVGELTGLTLANTQVLKVTGQAAGVGASSNDIVAKLGNVTWFPKA